ncbi:MAG: type II secretion system inner membrane protein GspF [Candidatus Riflebacteria bacterium]|nr:type II secretion system inner membrane protein GspF [Candidatus Riflebacteria bacterium]
MATYTYKARNWDGKMVNAEMDGESKEVCIAKLREKGYFVTNITEKKGGAGFSLSFLERGVSSQEVCIFARQFATMIGSGVPLVRCLTILQQQAENPAFKRIITQIRADVEGGATFSKALEKHPKVFSDLFCNLVKAGEIGGILDQILNRLADYLENSENLRSKVKGALTYPVVVFSIAGLVVIALVMFVLPQFKEIFMGMKVELPIATQILLGTSDFMVNWWFVVLPTLFGVPFLLMNFFTTKVGARLFDTQILKAPGIGMMMRKVAVAKFTRTLGTLIASGVPILQALEVTAQTAGNIVIAEAVDKTRVSIREGESIAEPLKESKVFPPMVVQMIAVGEETGELDKMLSKIADFYDTEVDNAVKGLTSIIEPIVIVFMGLIIGGIVLAVFMPMLKLVNAADG